MTRGLRLLDVSPRGTYTSDPVDLPAIEERLLAMLAATTLRLPSGEVDDMRSLVRAGEPGVAFENLCVQLVEHELTVDAETYQRLEELGEAMRLDPKYWRRLTREA